MLKPSVNLDAAMSADAVLERLALHGFWLDPAQRVARARLEALSARLRQPVETLAKRLERDVGKFGAAIRRQWGTRVLWYARELQEVLELCSAAPPAQPLIDVLNLHESESQSTIQLRHDENTELPTGVVMDAFLPVAVSFDGSPAYRHTGQFNVMRDAPGGAAVAAAAPAPATVASPRHGAEAVRGEVGDSPSAAAPAPVLHTWPRITAPDFVPALQPFDVIVGFAAERQVGVAGGPVALPAPPGVDAVDITVELSTGPGVQAPSGWSRPLRVQLRDVLSAQVTFQLVGIEPPEPERPLLTMLEVRYVRDGTVCGTAARPLVILHSSMAEPRAMPEIGEAWPSTAASASPMTLAADAQVPDLTIEISKPDRNAASGQYACQIFSPHALAGARGPFSMDLGQDAKTFAGSMVQQIRDQGGQDLLDLTLESLGKAVAQRLPPEVFAALRTVAAKVRPAVPAVLIVSAEPYVPWELAWVEQPIDAARPRYLGAQALVGRWLRDNDATAAIGDGAVQSRPAIQPTARMAVRDMAVMAGLYMAQTGLRRLPMAESEAAAIVKTYGGIELNASTKSIVALLRANLDRGPARGFGGVEAVHFAGHGDFDSSRPDGSALYLENGKPLPSMLFRAANYGGPQQPLMFLNACMLGIGGDLLGDMGGFPGNSLRGGFGGVLGALWEVDDKVAHDIALEFWQRALPPAPAVGEPVGAILRDLRAKYVPDAVPAPVSTYLAYVYYGHPRLTLERAVA